MKKTQIEKQIADFLKAKTEVMFAYIFGSFVQKDYYHDIDVAVYLYEDFDKNDRKKFPYGYESFLLSELNLLTRENVDLVIMNSAEILIQQRVINRGILLFSKDERLRIQYENYIRKLYIDAEHLRKIKRHYLARNIINA
ncbi:MAG: nucleotidyltransferase domain-containing protein [Bacteroidetes bacterium]|nr:nucleotidyltransferase domain-containing protein [Bacteroidota bacterium]MCL5738443.1 nucleotidyltransferase domain-containing protein [Bacteroidota bacterium]